MRNHKINQTLLKNLFLTRIQGHIWNIQAQVTQIITKIIAQININVLIVIALAIRIYVHVCAIIHLLNQA